MKKSFNYLSAVALLSVMLMGGAVMGKIEPWRISSTQTFFRAFHAGDTLGVYPLNSYLNSSMQIYHIRSYVSLHLNNNKDLCLPDSFDCSVGVRIYRWAADSSSLISKDTTLSVSYNIRSGVNYTEENRWYMEDMYRIKVEVLSVSCDSNIARLLTLDAAMEVEYYYLMTNAMVYITPSGLSATNVANDSSYVIHVSWSSLDFAEDYDLEWLYVDDYGTSEGSYLTISDADFKNNASRITINGTSFDFHPVFEHGKVFFRVRATARAGVDFKHRVDCQWSSKVAFSVSQTHEELKNWQYIATFAEEGKKMEVVTYMDGSLHKRQSVTQDNQNQMSIVGETIYDSEGRAGINILPVPAFNNSLKYFNDFNLNTSSTPRPYAKSDFETVGGTTCHLGAPGALSSTYGAGRYYSSSNPWATGSNIHDYIPDAGGYPFVQIEYTPDNTGRVRRQSGAGTSHIMGSGHETKYIYNTPDKEELVRLFGTNVGDVSHYKKNTVIDPNGQASISYLNASGKVIATALAGACPTNLSPLDSYGSPIEITTDLLATQNINQNSSRASYFFTVLESNQPVKLYYRMSVPKFHACLPSSNCFKGLYDLSISLEKDDSCQYQVFPSWPMVRKIDQNGTILDTLCSAGPVVYKFDSDTGLTNHSSTYLLTDSFLILNLSPGSYSLSRSITVDDQAATQYAELYLKQSTCTKTLADFEAEYLSQVDSSLCYPTCASCMAKIGTYADYLSKYIARIDSIGDAPTSQDSLDAAYYYNEMAKGCEDLCDTVGPCEAYLRQMMMDVSPSGQYFKLDATDTMYDVTETINVGRSYTRPITGLSDETVMINGEIKKVKQLTVREFIENFQPEWSRKLIVLHPEYCKYRQCVLQNDTSSFLEDFSSETSFDSALAKGYLNPLNLSVYKPTFPASTVIDPFFKTPTPSAFITRMTDSLTDSKFKLVSTSTTTTPLYYYIFAPTVAGLTYNSTDSTLHASFNIQDSLASRFSQTGNCRRHDDYIWTLFKAYYLRYRSNIIDTWRNDSCNSISIPSGKLRVFNDINNTKDMLSNSTLIDTNNLSTTMSDLAHKQCEAYAWDWMNKLKGCVWATLPDDSIALVDSLIAVCERGTDGRNPLGASTVSTFWKNRSTPLNKSFHDVLVNSSHYIKGDCDDQLIDFPGEYDHDYYADADAYTPLDYPDTFLGVGYDRCTCMELTRLKSIYDTASTICKVGGFAAYINRLYSSNFSNADLDAIMASCKAPEQQSSCDWPSPDQVSHPHSSSQTKTTDSIAALVKVPPALRCPSFRRTCLSYPELASYVESFVTYYGRPDTSEDLRDLMEKYLNNHLGFNLSYIDYMNFIAQFDTIYHKYYQYTIYDSTTYLKRPVFQDILVNEDVSCNCNKLLKGWAIWTAMNPHPTATFTDYVSKVLGFTIPFEPDATTIYELVDRCNGKVDTLSERCFLSTYSRCIHTPGTCLECTYSVLDSSYIENIEGSYWSYSTTTVTGTCINDTIWVIDYCKLDSMLDKSAKACTNLTPCELITNDIKYDTLNSVTAQAAMREDFHHDFSVFDYPVGKVEGRDSTTLRILCNEPTKDAQELFEIFNYLIDYDTFAVSTYVNLAKTPPWRASHLKKRYNDTCITCLTQQSNPSAAPFDFKLFISPFNTHATYSDYVFYLGTDTTNSCRIVFDSVHVSTLDSIAGFLHLRPGGAMHADGSQTFSVRAVLLNNDTITILGTSYCLPIAECCPPALKSRLCNAPFIATVKIDTFDCLTEQVALLKAAAYNAYNAYADSVKTAFKNYYIDSCMKHLATHERFEMKYLLRQNHYTLYYYDQADNLVQTVPPNGVHFLSSTDVQNVYANASNPDYVLEPAHTFKTQYQYNSLNQVIWQKTPDGGQSRFWYDELGRLILSQNAKQILDTSYSYTIYDALGRIREVGQIKKDALTVWDGLPYAYATHLTNVALAVLRTQITETTYDTTLSAMFNGRFVPHYLRSRVSAVTFRRAFADAPRHATLYDYDVHGNVQSLLQYNQSLDDLGQQYKQIDYSYDLISGKVNNVAYQYNEADAFYHHYDYDANNRITEVFTSRDSVIWDKDAAYKYYLHGPLARTEIQPTRHLQGIDYIYTIQGWIKSVNSNQLKGMRDPGKDGVPIGINAWANDVYGYSLSYFDGDYTPVNTGITTAHSPVAGIGSTSVLAANTHDLFNGNIRSMVTAISKFMGADNKPLGMAYKYDQLNRILESNAFNNFDTTNNIWSTSGSALVAYHNRFTYDANGNILAQVRRGAGATIPMDSLTYHYNGTDNKLQYVDDGISSSNYAEDIDDQSSGNYDYDAIGNLTKDNQEQIAEIKWTVYGKISDIIRSGGSSKPDLAFEYGPDGNRVIKIVKPKNDNDPWVYTYYVRDASGNVMATYSRQSNKKIQYSQITFSQVNDSLIHDQGASSWRDFMGDVTHIHTTTFSNDYIGYLLSNGLGANLLAHFNISDTWVSLDSTRMINVLSHYSFSDLLENALSCSFKNDLLNMMCSTFDAFPLAAYSYDKNVFLHALYSNDISAFEDLYTHFYGTLGPDEETMIKNLIDDQADRDVAAYIFGNYGCTLFMTILSTMDEGILRGIILSENSTDASVETVIRDYLNNLNLKVVAECFEAYDKSTLASKIFDAYPVGGSFDWTTFFKTVSNNYTVLLTYYSTWAGYTQDHHSYYSMTDYFEWIKAKWGDTYYNSLINRFYNASKHFQERYMVSEFDIYGSSRLGVLASDYLIKQQNFDADYSFITGKFTNIENIVDSSCVMQYNYKTLVRGMKHYEQSNHLGNVLVVISDKRITLCNGTAIAGYQADVISASDYYPFGMLMSTRSYSTPAYRYGFNGQEKDDEVAGSGNTNTAEYWEYDTRLGRRWNMDPLSNASVSVYECLGNNPVIFVDPNGLDVRNADELRRGKAHEKATALLDKLRSTEAMIGGKTKKAFKISGGDNWRSTWRDYKKTKNQYRNAKSKDELYTNRSKRVSEIIEQWKIESPETFKEVNEAVNERGEKVDFMLGVDQHFNNEGDETNAWGYNKVEYSIHTDVTTGVTTYLPYSDEFKENTVVVFINPKVRISSSDPETGQYSLNHEAGHFLFWVLHSTFYHNYVVKINAQKIAYKGGHNKGNLSGENAKRYGDRKK